MFKPVSSKVSFPKMEEEVLQFWKDRHIFEKSLQQRNGNDLFVLYEGPPTANGSPGIHHVLARIFKDLFPRYKTMRGYYAPRKAGWDTHGLPVELEVEKELKLSTKLQIEDYGIGRFNEKCRASVFRYVKDWERMTERIAFWVDLKDAYVTYSNEYIESTWWIMRQLWDKGLVYQGHRVPWHCPRCETTLSSHEVALGYEENTSDPSVYVRFEIDTELDKQTPDEKPWDTKDPLYDVKQAIAAFGRPAYLLAWTTTPWTLPGNVALAVDPKAEYTVITLAEAEDGQNKKGDVLILASAMLRSAIKGEYVVHEKLTGAGLVGLRYRPLLDPFINPTVSKEIKQFSVRGGHSNLQAVAETYQSQVEARRSSFKVMPADFVTMTDGTGIVHIAPAFGQDDYDLGAANSLLFVQHVDLSGKVTGDYSFKGQFFKNSDPQIIKDLQERGLMYRSERMKHTYPFCWRCKSPLINYAKASWYVRTSAYKDRLVQGNERINWYPEHIKHGRFGEWLANNVDWAISRERYWGTPIPIWQCQNPGCGHQVCVGSMEELGRLATGVSNAKVRQAQSNGSLDLHKPWLDEIMLRCEKCGQEMRRIPEVLDAWFDSGSMPIAQWHYPFANRDKIESSDPKASFHPADYICEAVDQTRGWFYSLHALSTLLFDRPTYENVICLGLILDAKGEKMSKSKGNVVEPFSVINTYGADATRWYLYTASPPGNSRRFSPELVQESVRQFLLPLWNVYSFFVTYANIDKFTPWLRLSGKAIERLSPEARSERESHESINAATANHELDRWLVSEAQSLIEDVTASLDGYDPTAAGRRIEKFVDDLSDWYVRRSRRRFWKSENDADKLQAYYTLYDALLTLSKLMAPLAPFVSDEIFRNLTSFDENAYESVHLADWPKPNKALIDEESLALTRLAMKLASLGRAARSKANIKVRQPIAKVLVKLSEAATPERLAAIKGQVLEELNVKELVAIVDEAEVAITTIKPNLPTLGPKFGGQLSRLTDLLSKTDARSIAAAARSGRRTQIGEFELDAGDVQVVLTDKPGFSTVAEGDYVVAVATKLTQDLIDEGIARELVHRIQNMRKSAGYDIADHIVSTCQGGLALKRAIESHRAYVMQETLSRELKMTSPDEGAYTESGKLEGEEITVGIKRV